MSVKTTPQKKKRRLKFSLTDLASLLSGLVIGELIASLTKNIAFLKWLSFDVAIGITQPLELNFVLFKLVFGFSFHFNPSVILFMLLAFMIGRMIKSSFTRPKRTAAESDGEVQ